MRGVGTLDKRTVDVPVYPASDVDRRSLNLSSILITTYLVFEHQVAYNDCIIISVFYHFPVVVGNELKLSGHHFVSLDADQSFGFLQCLINSLICQVGVLTVWGSLCLYLSR